MLEPAIDTGGPMGRMVLTVLGMVTEMELGFIRDRQRAGIDAAKARGVYKGRPATFDRARIVSLRKEGMGATEIAEAGASGATSTRRSRPQGSTRWQKGLPQSRMDDFCARLLKRSREQSGRRTRSPPPLPKATPAPGGPGHLARVGTKRHVASVKLAPIYANVALGAWLGTPLALLAQCQRCHVRRALRL